MNVSIDEQLKKIAKIVNHSDDVPHYVFRFGKYKTETLAYVFKRDPKYLEWLAGNVSNLDIVLTKFIHGKIL